MQTRRTATLAIAAAALSCGLTACGDDGTSDAQAACAAAPVDVDPSSRGREVLDQYERAADLAASAASTDSKWSDLATAYATALDVGTRVFELVDSPPEGGTTELPELTRRLSDANDVIRGACRIAES